MIVNWNNKTNLPVVEFEDSDFQNAAEISNLLEGKLPCRKCGNQNEIKAWKILEGYFASMRLSIEEIGKSHARSRAKKELCSNDFSILDGFDIAIGIPKKIVLQANMLKENQKKFNDKKEAENGRNDDE